MTRSTLAVTNASGHCFLARRMRFPTFAIMVSERIHRLWANRWLRETGLFAGFFVLNSLNAWQYIDSWTILFRELTYFSAMYAYALLQRVWLLPIVLDRQQPRRYALLSMLTLLPYAYAVMRLDLWLYADDYAKHPVNGPFFLFNLACLLAGTLLFNVPGLLRRFYHQRWQQDENQILRQQVELSNLRSQLNPHFLFNTLNNLYGLSLRQPNRAPDLILQLAGLMRYQLDSAGRALVPLSTEVAALEDYIGLETERVGSRCRVEYEGPGFVTNGLLIAPMLLMPFVENAFKHGTAGAEACLVSVVLTVAGQQVQLRVQNTVPRRATAVVSTGVGLANTRQRLIMLYPDRHQLCIEPSATHYAVALTISLTPQPAYA